MRNLQITNHKLQITTQGDSMKQLLFLLMFLMSTLLSSSFSLFAVDNSERSDDYLKNYTYQYVNASQENAATMFLVVSATLTPQLIFAYKNGGVLVGNDTEKIDAEVKVFCLDGSSKSNVVAMNRVWHEVGFMSKAVSVAEYCEFSFPESLTVAYTDGSNWDSRYGSNYHFTMSDFKKIGVAQTSSSRIAVETWVIINNFMRRD